MIKQIDPSRKIEWKTLPHLLLLILFFLVACDSDSNKRDPEMYTGESEAGDSLQADRSRQKTIVLSDPCVVMVVPDYSIPDSLIGVAQTDTQSLVENLDMKVSDALQFLDSARISVIDRKPEGTIGFKLGNGKLVNIPLVNHAWKIIFFNGKDVPVWSDMEAIHEDFSRYMTRTSTVSTRH